MSPDDPLGKYAFLSSSSSLSLDFGGLTGKPLQLSAASILETISGWVLLLALVLPQPCFPAESTCRLLWAGIATLAQGAGCFARQEDRDDGPVHPTLLEPDPRQLSRGGDLRAAHIRQATGGPSLHDLTETPCHFLLGHGLEQPVCRHKRHQGEPGQHL